MPPGIFYAVLSYIPCYYRISFCETITERMRVLKQTRSGIKRIWKGILAGLLSGILLLSMSMGVAADGAYLYDESEAVVSPWEEDDRVWAPTAAAVSEAALNVGGKSAVLMEQSTGEILYEKNSHEKLPIASVTKIMTLLLTMEALSGELIRMEDTVTCSKTAASMGGSQIWLEEGEQMTVDDLLKAAVIVSANDACAALAEHLCGTIDNFVARMNERATELGMADTLFLDCSGLSDDAYSSAHDVAVMARELMKHKEIQRYTTVWMDTLRDGESQLVNTNKLVRHYDGATGLKTGTTQKAGHCLAATAEREGIAFVAVILGCDTTDERFGGARAMLDYGFANFSLYTPAPDMAKLTPIPVKHGLTDSVSVAPGAVTPILLKKGQEKQVVTETELAADLTAPVEMGQVVGNVRLLLDNELLTEIPIRAQHEVAQMTFLRALKQLLYALCT